MSDLPADGTAAPAAAWFVDPMDPTQWRWWDGSAWTEHVSPVVSPAEAQAAGGTSGQPEEQRWSLPPLDSPLHPRDGYSTAVHPSVRGAFRLLLMRRSLSLSITIAVGLVASAIAAAARFDGRGDGRWEQLNVVSQAVKEVRDEARDRPWDTAFRTRGLDASEHRRLLPRWSELVLSLPVLAKADCVEPRWARSAPLCGMPSCWGELVTSTYGGEDGRDRYAYRLFAAFQLPPMAGRRHPGVSVRRRGPVPSSRVMADGSDLKLESIAVARSLRIELHGRSDELSARELFGPQLVAALADHPVSWDQRGDVLLVFEDSSSEPIRDADRFLQSAAAVARAYWADQD